MLEYALNLMKISQENADADIKIDKAIPLYGMEGDLIGFYINLKMKRLSSVTSY